MKNKVDWLNSAILKSHYKIRNKCVSVRGSTSYMRQIYSRLRVFRLGRLSLNENILIPKFLWKAEWELELESTLWRLISKCLIGCSQRTSGRDSSYQENPRTAAKKPGLHLLTVDIFSK